MDAVLHEGKGSVQPQALDISSDVLHAIAAKGSFII